MAKPRSTAPRETTADPDAQNQADGDDDADEDVEKDGDAENGLGEVSAGAGEPIDVDGAEGALRPDVVARPRRAAGALAPARGGVERFLAEVRRYPRLTEEEERALGKAVRDGGDREAARKLVVHNLRLVVA